MPRPTKAPSANAPAVKKVLQHLEQSVTELEQETAALVRRGSLLRKQLGEFKRKHAAFEDAAKTAAMRKRLRSM